MKFLNHLILCIEVEHSGFPIATAIDQFSNKWIALLRISKLLNPSLNLLRFPSHQIAHNIAGRWTEHQCLSDFVGWAFPPFHQFTYVITSLPFAFCSFDKTYHIMFTIPNAQKRWSYSILISIPVWPPSWMLPCNLMHPTCWCAVPFIKWSENLSSTIQRKQNQSPRRPLDHRMPPKHKILLAMLIY